MNVIHIGLQRTGNTTIQNAVFQKLPDFQYIGKRYDKYPDTDTRDLVNQIAFQDSLDYDLEKARKSLENITSGVGDKKPILFSDEVFSVEGRADRRIVAERLYKLLQPSKIIISLRSQFTLLQALYLKHLTGSRDKIITFSEWLERNYSGIRFQDHYRIGLDYDRLVRAYEDVFGAENVIVILSEEMHIRGSHYFQALEDCLGLPGDVLWDQLEQSQGDQRLSSRHLLMLKLQNLLPEGTNLATVGRRVFPSFLYEPIKKFSTGGKRTEPPQLTQHWREIITAFSSPGNKSLAARRHLPLKDYGYPGK